MTRRVWRGWIRPVAILIGAILVLLSFGDGLTGDQHVHCYRQTCTAPDHAPPPGN